MTTTSTGGTPLDVATVMGSIAQYANNPTAGVRNAFSAYNQINNGSINIVDATNPFVFAVENTILNTSVAMQTAAALTRRLYPGACTTREDLYIHMSDTDYVDIFAVPTDATFTVLVSMQGLLNALVVDSSTGIGQVTIPRNTKFSAAGVPFSLQYPINIQKLPHGGLQVVYDTSSVSPLQTIATNVIPYSIAYDANQNEYLSFSVATQQFDIIEKITTVSSVGGFTVSVPYSDQFYYCRVYTYQSTTGKWEEIQTTYTEQVYNPNTPTAVIQVTDTAATVTIPIIYVSNGTVAGKVRVDVYETKGPISVALGNYDLSQFSADFIALDQNDRNQYVAAFTSITNIACYSASTTTGGRAALSFTELQQRVISSSIGPRNKPITPSNIQTALIDLGYTLVKNVDTITNRQYLATKSLPAPTGNNLVTPANASMLTTITTIAKAAQAYGCTTHTTGMTITSAALLQETNGITALITSAAYQAIKAQTLAQQCITINSGNYYYTPFYYVLDTSTEVFRVRPYFLDSPKINSCSFVATNATTQLQVGIAPSYSIVKTSTGYQLTLTTSSNTNFQDLQDSEVFCQIAFKSSAQAQTAYLLGVQQTKAAGVLERTYVFEIDTNYDIDDNDQLVQSSFTTTINGLVPRSDLIQDISVFFGTTNVDALSASKTSIDAVMGIAQIAQSCIGITQQTLNIEFGYALSNLWNSYRAIAGAVQYKTYPANVPALYGADVYAKNNVTGAIINTDAQGHLVLNKIHSKGDPVLDAAGNPTYLHRAGDTVLDANGSPVPVDGYQTLINYSVDIMALDAIYQFANDAITREYVDQINASLITTLTSELTAINNEALENTQAYYYPAVTKGSANVVVDNNQVLNMEMALRPIVTLYVSADVKNNEKLQENLTSTTIETIGTYLQNNATVAVSVLEDQLQKLYGSDVEGVSIAGFGNGGSYKIISVTDASARLGIQKVLGVQPNNQLAVQEGIQLIYKLHTPNNI